VLRDGFGTEHAIIYKREADLVTEIDEEAERVIRDELLGTFPSYRMLVEESSRVRRKPAGSEGSLLDRGPLGRHHQLRSWVTHHLRLRSVRESRRGGAGVLRKQRIPLTNRAQQRPPR
jgi:hypothetical protein